MSKHETETLADFRAELDLPPDPDREVALEFAHSVLARAQDVTPVPRTWFPTRADGRDPSGVVHVSVVNSTVALLDVPLGMLQNPQEAGEAIRAALNLALERHQADVTEYLRRRGGARSDAPEPSGPDWAALATQAARLRQGWC